jgi:ABC-2 type transport system ATP-binding protein
MNLFESNQASKTIDRVMIIDNVTVSISKGERVAITGSNGSGKSSLLKLIGGFYEGSEGQVKRANIKVGYVPEHFPENIRFQLKEFLMLTGKINSNKTEDLEREIEKYAGRFSINDYLHTPLKNCSKGTKQKAGIIQALIKDPDLLLLDEPLTGLDDQAQMELLNQLQSVTREKTIIFTAHESLLVEELADRILRVDGGKIVSDSMKMETREKQRIITAQAPSRESSIQGIPCIRHQWIGENTVEMLVLAKESDPVLKMLLERGCSIIELKEMRWEN